MLDRTPVWWTDTVFPKVPEVTPSGAYDVVVIGAGYTGLNAALETARAGRSTLVLEAKTIGTGCSSRNGGQIGTSLKPDYATLAKRYGIARANAITEVPHEALDWLEGFLAREAIACDFARVGRFHAAHTPRHFDWLVDKALGRSLPAGAEVRKEGVEVVARKDQDGYIATRAYFGGVLLKRHASLQPGQYLAGLLGRALAAGVAVKEGVAARGIERSGDGFLVRTGAGDIRARDVLVATNGYSGNLVPWLARRIIPIGSYMMATEPIAADVMDRLMPRAYVFTDTRKVVYYYRPSPDRRRIVFGGRVSSGEVDPAVTGPLLRAEMVRLFPELAGIGLAHSWMGTVAYTFDALPHTGVIGGIHYALGYCGSGVSMASYLGMRAGQRILGKAEARTAFDDLPFPTRPLYSGKPWFLPAVVAYYRMRDRHETRQASVAERQDGAISP